MTTGLQIAIQIGIIACTVSGVLLGWSLRVHQERRRKNMMDRLAQRKTAGGINVTCLVSNGHTWVFMFRDDKRAECLRTLGRFASDKNLGFTWYDAARLSQAIRKDSSTEL